MRHSLPRSPGRSLRRGWVGRWAVACAAVLALALAPLPAATASAAAVSATAGAQTAAPPLRSVHPPTIGGAVRAGAVLTAKPGTWSVTPTSFSYQWYSSGAAVTGAVLAAYTPAGSDVGHTITVTVTAGAAGFTPATAVSAPTKPVAAGILTPALPAVQGDARVGRVVTAVPGLWNPPGVAFTYQWLRASVVIPGATAKTYTLTRADLGKRLSVTVTGSAAGFTPLARQSLRTDQVVAADAPETSGTGRITGTLSGGTLGNYITDGSLYVFPAGYPEPVDLSGTYNNGRFSFSGVAPGEYTLFARATWNGITSESYYGGGHDLDTAATFVVKANGSTEVTFVIERGGTINGRVTAPADQPVTAAAVVYDTGGFEIARSPVASDGTYSVQTLSVGTYRLFIETTPDSSLAGSWWKSGSSPLTATPIVIGQRNQVVTGVDVALSVGGSVSGSVRSAVTGKLVGWVEVLAYLADDSADTVLRTTGILRSDGTFSFTGLPAGKFKLRVTTDFSQEQDLASTWIGGTTRATATVFTTVAGRAAPTQNIVLQRGASITVSVVSGSPPEPLLEGGIVLERVGGDASETRYQGSSSPYPFTGLTPGTYRLSYRPFDPTMYSDVTVPSPVVVKAGDNPTVTIVVLRLGG